MSDYRRRGTRLPVFVRRDNDGRILDCRLKRTEPGVRFHIMEGIEREIEEIEQMNAAGLVCVRESHTTYTADCECGYAYTAWKYWVAVDGWNKHIDQVLGDSA